MGNSSTKEARVGNEDTTAPGYRSRADEFDYRVRNRMSRGDIGTLGLLAGSSRDRRGRNGDPDAPFEHRETRSEREARKLEKERAQRAKDREQSLREEHVDGGYLVTLGTYTGTEDFNKSVVRQLQVGLHSADAAITKCEILTLTLTTDRAPLGSFLARPVGLVGQLG